jgi:energy-coupling factor transporter ATP-binding protein EcfA2
MSSNAMDVRSAARTAGREDGPTLTSRDVAVPLIDLRKVCRTFVTDGGVEVRALRDVDLKIYPGEFIAIVGQSGSGKSTLMNILGCLDRPTSGTYLFGGRVGVDKGDVFERVTKDVAIPMESGDVLLLYTDGINEATDHKGLEFGEERIKTVLGLAAPNGAQAVVDALCEAVQTFAGSEAQADDITLVVVRRK